MSRRSNKHNRRAKPGTTFQASINYPRDVIWQFVMGKSEAISGADGKKWKAPKVFTVEERRLMGAMVLKSLPAPLNAAERDENEKARRYVASL